MPLLTDHTRRADTLAHFTTEALWDLFDGNRDAINIAHECIDRHVGGNRVAIRIAYAGGNDDQLTFEQVSRGSAQVAHRLAAAGIAHGDRIAIMLEPSPAFYLAMFGALKLGAAVVPLFTLFGPDAIAARIEDSGAKLLITTPVKVAEIAHFEGLEVWSVDARFMEQLDAYPDRFEARTAGGDVAFLQYTSGTTRQMPQAVRMTHRSIVITMLQGLYGVGLRQGDICFCPSSPAWAHGLWQGTLAPLALGLAVGTYSGKFDAHRFADALERYGVTNLAAAATHYRMLRTTNALAGRDIPLTKLSFAGEPIDGETEDFLRQRFGVRVCSIYGTTEVGALMVHFPEAEDVPDKLGSLGLPLPGIRIEVQRLDGSIAAPGEVGEIKVWRHGGWIATRDLGRLDEDGFFYHAGRADDVIISAGWTLSAVEIESVLLRHPDIREATAIGVPDPVRGQVVKAFVISPRPGDDAFSLEIQQHVRAALGSHEYPRQIAFVSELPKTPVGKINRKVLRDRERESAA